MVAMKIFFGLVMALLVGQVNACENPNICEELAIQYSRANDLRQRSVYMSLYGRKAITRSSARIAVREAEQIIREIEIKQKIRRCQ